MPRTFSLASSNPAFFTPLIEEVLSSRIIILKIMLGLLPIICLRTYGYIPLPRNSGSVLQFPIHNSFFFKNGYLKFRGITHDWWIILSVFFIWARYICVFPWVNNEIYNLKSVIRNDTFSAFLSKYNFHGRGLNIWISKSSFIGERTPPKNYSHIRNIP